MFNKGLFAGMFMLTTIAVDAQFKRGDKMVGTSIASMFFNSGGADVSFPQGIRGYSSKTTSYGLRIEPSFGWFFSEKTAVGASLNINPSGQKVRYEDLGTAFQEDKSTTFNIGVGGFLRNYFGSSNFMPFGQFGFNAGISSSTTEGFKYYTGTPNYKVTYDGKSSGGFFANAAILLGLTKMVGESTGLDIYLGYNYSYNKNTFKTTTLTDNAPYDGVFETRAENEPTSKFTNHGVMVGVGLQVFIKHK